MRKRGKVKNVLTIFIIVLFSCTAVIGNSRTGVIENVMAKNAADVDILCDGQMVHHIQLLMYDADARRLRFRNILELDRLSEELYLSAVPRIDTAQYLHQSGLSGSVLAHERMHFTRTQIKADIPQRINARELL